MVYTETEAKESLLSDLIFCFNAHDDYNLIGHINDTVDVFLQMMPMDESDYHLNLIK